MTELSKPGVIVHAFFLAEHVQHKTSPARPELERLWNLISQDLPEPFDRERKWPSSLPDAIGDEARLVKVLAGVRRTDVDGIHEAVAYQTHDVVGISLLVARDDTDASWPTIGETWFDGWTRWTKGILGAVRLHVGLTSDDHHARIWSATPDHVQSILRGQPAPRWGRAWWRPVKQLVLWELTVPEPAHPVLTRSLLAVAARRDEEVTEDWFWSNAEDPAAMPPFTSYLLHAAKMRYERELLQKDTDRLRATATKVRSQSGELATVLSRDRRSISHILQADRVLSDLRWDNDGLGDSLSLVRDMTQTVRVAQANMTSTLSDAEPGKNGSPVEIDRQLCRWTVEQLLVTEAYLDSAQRRAAEMQRLAGAEVEEALVERRENLVVLQTAVIGAVLMALAAIQSLEYKAEWLPSILRAPVIFLLAALALVLPSGVLRWPRGGSGDAAFAKFDIASIAVLAAAATWFAVTLVA